MAEFRDLFVFAYVFLSVLWFMVGDKSPLTEWTRENRVTAGILGVVVIIIAGSMIPTGVGDLLQDIPPNH
jgi:hypothetical protein